MINSSLLVQDEQKLKRLERVAQATQEMMGDLGATSLLDRLQLIAQCAAEILEAETSGVFLVHDGKLVLEASFGQREEFDLGKVPPLEIHDRLGGGLTGYIAYHGKLFNDHGESLKRNPAVAHSAPHTPSGECYSLLAIPLKKQVREKKELIGIIRVDNKKGNFDQALATLVFSQEDEWILTIFAEAAMVAIESAELVDRLKEQGEFRERLISSSPAGIIAVDRRGLVTEFNSQAEHILGYSKKEVIGTPVAPLYLDSKEPRRIGQLLHKAPDHHVRAHETFVKSKQAKAIPIRHASTWLLDSKGSRIGSVGYFEDLRPQKALERRESLLLKASNLLVEADVLDNGLQQLAELMVSELRRSFCGILLMDEGEYSLTLRAECLEGNPQWKSARQQIVLSEWEGLWTLLQAGDPWVKTWNDPRDQSVLIKLKSVLGFSRDIGMLLVVPLKIGDRVVGQLDFGDLHEEGRPAFSKEEIDLVSALAAQVTILIDRFQLLEAKMRKEGLLEALVEASRHIRAEVEMSALQQVIVRLATELARCRVGGLFLHRPYLKQLELAAIYGAPEDLVGKVLAYEDRLIDKVAREGELKVSQRLTGEDLFVSLGLRIVAAVPFRAASGEVEAVLFLGDPIEHSLFGLTDLEILKAFANQATIALQTARLMDREQLYFNQIASLHQISGYIQKADQLERILHPVLTGVTASYGLGFNRAILMLVNEFGDQLVGSMGIGQLEEEDARAAWALDNKAGLSDLRRYLQRLDEESLELTTLGEQVPKFSMPVRRGDIFSEVIQKGELRKVGVSEFCWLSPAFIETFRVKTPLAIAPLVAKEQVIGILVVDNKFTQAPIGDEACDALMMFAATAAVAIYNRRLFEQTRSDADKLLAFQAAAEVVARVTLLEEPGNTLKSIADEIRGALNCGAVVLFKYDQDTGKLIFPSADSGLMEGTDYTEEVADYSLVYALLEHGKLYVASDTSNDVRFKGSPFARIQRIKSCVAIPLNAAGRKVGIIFINYRNSRTFTDDELAVMEMFSNQAAVAIRNSQLFEERDNKLKQQEALASLSRGLLGAKTVREAMDRAVSLAAEVLGVELCNIVLPDREGRLMLRAAVGWQRHLIGKFRVRPGEDSQTGYTIQTRKPVAVEDYSKVTFRVPKIVAGQGIRSGLSVPMFVGEKTIGAMVVHTRRRRHFTSDDETLLSLIANQTAIALERLRHYEESVRKSAYLAALYEASTAVTAGFGLERRKILEQIMQAALQGIAGAHSPKPLKGTIQLYDEDRDELILESVYPLEQYGGASKRIVERRFLRATERKGTRIGITGRTVLTGQPQLVRDVKKNRDYIEYYDQTLSELAVPLLDRGEVIGVLNAESNEVGAFDEDDRDALQALSILVVVAIQNARQLEELKEAKLLVDTRTTLAWMGIGNLVRRHEMASYVGIIRGDLTLLRKELKRLSVEDEPIKRVLERIDRMARAAARMNVSLSGRVDAQRKPFLINNLLRSWKQRFQVEKLDPNDLHLRCELPETVAARANVFWLKQVMNILVSNAIEATSEISNKMIVVGSRKKGSWAEIYVSDNGSGIREEIRRKLFREPIERKPKNVKGLGMGLLIAHAVIQIYGGNLYIDEQSDPGTIMVIALPLERGSL